MITLAEINAIASKFNVSPETIEKDYMISWILICLSKSKLRENFMFYGGTAIKRIYFEDHRFSEDIDLLSANHFTDTYILHELKVLEYALKEANLVFEINQHTIIRARDRIQLFIHYTGYEEIIGAQKEIRIDLAMNMNRSGDTEDKKIIKSYTDIPDERETLSVMTLNTILANKLGLLMDLTRNEPRDLFDIYFLLQRKGGFNFVRVCKIFKDNYGFLPSLSILRPHLMNKSLKKNWDIRLNKQVSELPDIKMVIKVIEESLHEFLS